MILKEQDVKSFIEGLELSEPSGLESFVDYTLYESTAENPTFLNYKSLNAFSSEVSAQTQQDVLNSVLLAQRAANKKFPNNDQLEKWYEYYFEVLSNLGWVLEQKGFSNYMEKTDKFEMDKALIELVADSLTAGQVKILLKAINALKNLNKDDNRIIAFEKNTKQGSKGNFQLGLAEENNGLVTLAGSGFILETVNKMTQVLFFKFDKEQIKLSFALHKAVLNLDNYSKHRQLVVDKLGNVDNFIASLDI